MRLQLRGLAVLLVVAGVVVPSAGADDGMLSMVGESVDPTVGRLEQIEAELAALNSRVDQIPQECSGDCGAGCCYSPPCGAYAGFAFVFAKPHFAENVSYNTEFWIPGQVDTVWSPFHYDRAVAPRVWFGWQGTSGFGLRYSYWQFDQSGDAVSLMASGAEIIPTAFIVDLPHLSEAPQGLLSIDASGPEMRRSTSGMVSKPTCLT
jgi:hypothetical protein